MNNKKNESVEIKKNKNLEENLIKNINITRDKIEIDNVNFQYAKGKLIDYYIYNIKANQAKLDYLLDIAKIEGIRLEITK